MSEHYVVDLNSLGEIPDDIILATDAKGDELLRFGLNCGGRWIKCRYPRYGDWDQFTRACAEIFQAFAAECDSIEIPDNLGDDTVAKHDVALWCYIQAAIQVQRQCMKKIDATFFRYLLPQVDGVGPRETRAWIGENASINLPFGMFAAIMRADQWAKKKAQEILLESYHHSTQPISIGSYTKNTAGQKPILPEPALLGFM